jgi:hypothetical protein
LTKYLGRRAIPFSTNQFFQYVLLNEYSQMVLAKAIPHTTLNIQMEVALVVQQQD